MKILKANREDFNGIFILLKQLWPDRKLNRGNIKKVFLKGLVFKHQEFIVAKNNKDIVGFGSMIIKNNIWQGGSLAYIDELVVDQRHRGRRIGAKLLKHLMNLAKKHSCKNLKLDSAFHRKRTHRFYENKGFKKCGFIFLKKL